MLVAGIVAFAGVYFVGDDSTEQAAPNAAQPAAEAAAPPATAKPKLDAAARKIATDFIRTAVAREDVAASWPLLHPDLRQGFTLSEWKTGNIPVVPYPVGDMSETTMFVEEAYTGSLLLQVALMPAKDAQIRPAMFQLGLRAVGSGADRHWLVDYWMPRWSPPIPATPG